MEDDEWGAGAGGLGALGGALGLLGSRVGLYALCVAVLAGYVARAALGARRARAAAAGAVAEAKRAEGLDTMLRGVRAAQQEALARDQEAYLVKKREADRLKAEAAAQEFRAPGSSGGRRLGRADDPRSRPLEGGGGVGGFRSSRPKPKRGG